MFHQADDTTIKAQLYLAVHLAIQAIHRCPVKVPIEHRVSHGIGLDDTVQGQPMLIGITVDKGKAHTIDHRIGQHSGNQLPAQPMRQ